MKYFFNKISYNYCESSDNDNWIKYSFPLCIIGIFLGLLFPFFITRFTSLDLAKSSSFLRIIFSTIPIQLFLVSAIIFPAIFSRPLINVKNKLSLTRWKNKYIKEVVYTELIIIVPLFVVAAIVYSILRHFNLTVEAPINKLLSVAKGGGLMVIFITSVFIAPVVEELTFRRILFTRLHYAVGTRKAMVITSLAFALLHVGLVQIIPLFLLGYILQLLYLKNNSIYPSILLHSLHNFINILPILYFYF